MGLKSKLSGSGYVVLNIFRGLNVVSLLACIAAAVSMLIKTFFINGFGLFDTISHVLTILMSVFLILSEVPFGFVKSYFQKNWPLLSYESGFVTLGIFMIVDGCMVLANLNSSNASADAYGSSFFQIIEAGGILAFVMGILNIIVSYVFRDRKIGVTARMVRRSGATAAQQVANDIHWQTQERGTPRTIERSSPSMRTVVSSASDQLPLHNSGARSYTASIYSQATAAAPADFQANEGKGVPEMPPVSAHPAYKHATGAEFV